MPGSQPPSIEEESRYSFAVRYGPVLAHHGVGTYPDALLDYRAELVNPACIRGCRYCGRPLTTPQFLFLLAIFKHRYSDAPCWPSTAQIASYWDWDYSHAQKIKNSLEAAGWIVCTERYTEDGRVSDLLDPAPLLGVLEDLVFKHAAAGDVDLPLHLRPKYLSAAPRPVPDPSGPQPSPLSTAPSGQHTTAGTGQKTTARSGPRTRGASGRFTGGPPVPGPEELRPTQITTEQYPLSSPTEHSRTGARRPPLTDAEATSDESTRTTEGYQVDALLYLLEQFAREFADNDAAQSRKTAHHLYWNSQLPADAFSLCMKRAYYVTRQRLDRGQVHGRPMAFFFGVLQGAVADEQRRRQPPAAAPGSSPDADPSLQQAG